MDIHWRYVFTVSFGTLAAYGVSLLLPDILVSRNLTMTTLWVCISALFAAGRTFPETLELAKTRMIATTLGIGIAVPLFLIPQSDFALAVQIFVGSLLCAALGHLAKAGPHLRVAGITFLLVVILKPMRPDVSGWLFAFLRWSDSLIGCLLAIIVSRVVWIGTPIAKWAKNAS
ncbi:MAG: FUSC family protein [Deltaproteobacteria bacterium]|nr:FUSC family protein [Deltaproteobacteria bacterium]